MMQKIKSKNFISEIGYPISGYLPGNRTSGHRYVLCLDFQNPSGYCGFRKSFLGIGKFLIIIVMLSMVLPIFGFRHEAFAQTAVAPQTVREAENIGADILEKLPDSVKTVWRNEALPIFKKMIEISLKIWNKTLGPVVEPWLRKETEKRRPALEQEFQKERKEIQNELWERFKDLLK